MTMSLAQAEKACETLIQSVHNGRLGYLLTRRIRCNLKDPELLLELGQARFHLVDAHLI